MGAESTSPDLIGQNRFVRAIVAGLLASVAITVPVAPATAQAQPQPQPQPQQQVTPPNRTDLVPPGLQRQERTSTLTIDGGFERAPCALDREEYADIRLTLQGAQFDGLERVPGLSLDSAFLSYVGRELPLSVLCDIRAQANGILRREGYLATVEIPEQNLADGVADFRVVFGRLTAVRVRGEAGPSEALVARYLEKLTGQDVFNTNQAERYLLLADDIPGLDVRLSLRPASEGAPGDLVGEIAVVRQRGAVVANVQNFGSSAIGPFGGSLQAEIYDVTGLGDRTSFTAFSTLEFTEQQTFQIGHDFRIGGEGLRLGGQLTYSISRPDTGLANFNTQAETVVASVFASAPVQRTRMASTFIDVGLDIVDQDIEINAIPLTRDRVRTLYARLSGEMVDRASVQRLDGYTPFEPRFRLTYAGEVRHGIDVFSTSPDCRPSLAACFAGGAVPPSRVESDPTPLLLRYDVALEYRPVPLFTLAARTSAQITNSPLPAFEEFAAGSFSIGRGYDPGAVLGDSGIGGALELRYGSLVPDGLDALAVQPYVFTDVAFAWNEDPSRLPLNPDRLWSAGGGLRAAWGSQLQGDVMIAVPLVTPDFALNRGDVRLMFSLTARLFPWRF